MVDDSGVPAFIRQCIEIIEKEGLDTVGLYRISGKREDIVKMQEKYDQGIVWLHVRAAVWMCVCVCVCQNYYYSYISTDPNMDINSLGVCVNAVTGTLKSFFKVLPDPLIPEKLLTPLLDIPG